MLPTALSEVKEVSAVGLKVCTPRADSQSAEKPEASQLFSG